MTLVFVRHDVARKTLQALYDGHLRVINWTSKNLLFDVNSEDWILLDSLKIVTILLYNIKDKEGVNDVHHSPENVSEPPLQDLGSSTTLNHKHQYGGVE